MTRKRAVYNEGHAVVLRCQKIARNPRELSNDDIAFLGAILTNQIQIKDVPLQAQKLVYGCIFRAQSHLDVETSSLSVIFPQSVIDVYRMESTDFSSFLTIIEHWAFESFRLMAKNINEDQFNYTLVLLKRCAKFSEEFSVLFTKSEQFYLRLIKRIFIRLLWYSDLWEKDMLDLFKLASKTFILNTDIFREIFSMCVEEFSLELRGKWLLLSVLLESTPFARASDCEQIMDSHLSALLHEFSQAFEEQSVCALVSPAILSLALVRPHQPALICLIADVASSLKNANRSNNLMMLLTRLCTRKELSVFLHDVLSLLSDWFDACHSEDDSIWPLKYHNLRLVTCVDARFGYDEDETPLWEKDRFLLAYLTVLNAAHLRNPHEFRIEKNLELKEYRLLRAGLAWYHPEVREVAVAIAKRCDFQFLSLEELQRAHPCGCDGGEPSVRHFYYGPESESEIEETIRKQLEKQDPLDEKDYARQLELFLVLGGSTSIHTVPQIPELYAYAKEQGMTHRIYTKALNDRMTSIFNSKEHDDEYKFTHIWNATSRCRLQAVILCGTEFLDNLISASNEENLERWFHKLTPYLTLEEAQVRTGAISRVLWSLCSTHRPLFVRFWHTIQKGRLLEFNVKPALIRRVCKTMRLFFSKSNCELPVEAYYYAFSQCIDLQTHEDFSVRSGAIQAYGALLEKLAHAKRASLFVFIARHSSFWDQKINRLFDDFCILDRVQRIMLMNFISMLKFASVNFYDDEDKIKIDKMRHILLSNLLQSLDIRERRVSLDTFYILMDKTQMKRCSQFTSMQDYIAYFGQFGDSFDMTSANDLAALLYFDNLIRHKLEEKLDRADIPADALGSTHVRFIEEVVQLIVRLPSREAMEGSDDTSNADKIVDDILQKVTDFLSSRSPSTAECDEQGWQTASICMLLIAEGLGSLSNISELPRKKFISACRELMQKDSEGVEMLLARLPSFLNPEHDVYYNKFDLLKMLENDFSE